MEYVQSYPIIDFPKLRDDFITKFGNGHKEKMLYGDYNVKDPSFTGRTNSPKSKEYFDIVMRMIHHPIQSYVESWNCNAYEIQTIWCHQYNDGGEYSLQLTPGKSYYAEVKVRNDQKLESDATSFNFDMPKDIQKGSTGTVIGVMVGIIVAVDTVPPICLHLVLLEWRHIPLSHRRRLGFVANHRFEWTHDRTRCRQRQCPKCSLGRSILHHR